MNTLHNLILGELQKHFESGELTPKKFKKLASDLPKTVLPKIATLIFKRLKRTAPQMLRYQRKELDGFRARHGRRWRKGLDLFELLIAVCSEAGSDFNNEFRPKAVEEHNYIFEAVVSLHARALLAASEVYWLLRGGFPDGALSRWRSLHELAVVALFLSKNDRETAERYLASFHIQAYHALLQYQRHQRQAKLEPFPRSQVRAIKVNRDRVIEKYGESIDTEYGWASLALNKRKPTFRDLEVNISLDHWRPRYKWASQYTHANFKPRHTLLGMSGAHSDVLLVGPSNAGLTDPAHMTAISLVQVTTALLMLEPNFDRIVTVLIMNCLLDEIGETFLATERKLMDWHSKKVRER
jgi:hypothetical protein